jgi:amino acid transporter
VHLKTGQLGTRDLTVSTVANIGPGIDFYFAFGVIAVTAGVAAPLTILAAGIAVIFLAAVVAEFTRAEPSAGSSCGAATAPRSLPSATSSFRRWDPPF